MKTLLTIVGLSGAFAGGFFTNPAVRPNDDAILDTFINANNISYVGEAGTDYWQTTAETKFWKTGSIC